MIQIKRRKHSIPLIESESDDSSTEGSIDPIRANLNNHSSDEYGSSKDDDEAASSPVNEEKISAVRKKRSEKEFTTPVPIGSPPSSSHVLDHIDQCPTPPTSTPQFINENQSESEALVHLDAEVETNDADKINSKGSLYMSFIHDH